MSRARWSGVLAGIGALFLLAGLAFLVSSRKVRADERGTIAEAERTTFRQHLEEEGPQ